MWAKKSFFGLDPPLQVYYQVKRVIDNAVADRSNVRIDVK